LYQWAKDVLIPNLYYTINYNGENTSPYEKGYLADMYSWRLGPPKLRQLRVKKGIELMLFLNCKMYKKAKHNASLTNLQ